MSRHPPQEPKRGYGGHQRLVPISHGIAVTALAGLLTVGTLLAVNPGSASLPPRTVAHSGRGLLASKRAPVAAKPATAASHIQKTAAPTVPRVTIGETTVRMVDPQRTISVAGRTVPRSFDTLIRYPIGLRGPFPLIVFGHGYNVTPAPYSLLLNAWARAGYVVAAPVFPLENQSAIGGPNENDLPNQPADMSLVISSLQSPATLSEQRLAQMVNFSRIAVSGQSDGGDTALAAAYDASVRDTRITAAAILSGAEDPFARPFGMPANGPPLLAVQGTADTINPPNQTRAFYDQATAPKYLLELEGAGHQPPYTQPGPELTEVEKMTIAFFSAYLKGQPAALMRLMASRSAGSGTILSFERPAGA